MRFSPLSLLSAATLFAIAVSAADSSTAAAPTEGTTAALPNLSSAAASESAAKASSTAAKTTNSVQTSGAGTKSAGKTTASITGSGSAAPTTEAVPTITGSSISDDGALTGLPTLTGAFVVVAASVPPTADAPFMRSSTMPEGTVFIAVGAILGFLALSVLLWRGLVAWALHRSVKRAAMTQGMSHEKSAFRAPAAPFYRYKDQDSSLSLANLKASNRRSSRPVTANLPGSTSQPSLFFSPTANTAGANNAGNRGSSYLPAGYYAAGAAQPGNGHGTTHIGQQPSISMTNLGHANRDSYVRAQSVGPSPPGTPGWSPHHGASSSTVNLNHAVNDQRAPSAYLDDLFDREDGLPLPGHHNRF